jgi:hypothetical protein
MQTNISITTLEKIDLEKAHKVAAYQSVNDMKRKMLTKIKQAVTEKFYFKKKGTVTKMFLKTKRATYKKPVTNLITRKTYPISLIKFKPKPSRRAKKTNPMPTIEVLKGKRSPAYHFTRTHNIFLGKDKKGKIHVWERMGKGGRNRFITKAKLNLTVADMIGDEQLERQYVRHFKTIYNDRYKFFLTRAVSNLIQKSVE